jgi:hypothetical protein
MFKTRRLIVETVVFLLLATLLITFYGGENKARADSLPEPGKFDEKIENGLNLALEAIRIAGNHKEVKGKTTVSSIDNEIDQNEGFPEKNTDPDVEDKIAERPYKKTAEMHNPLITEHIKIKKKHREKHRASAPIHYAVKIPANKPWTWTGVSLKQNDVVKIYCNGKVMPGKFEHFLKQTSCTPKGFAFWRGDCTVLHNTNYMAAIGKIGSDRDAFYIGSGREFVSYVDGPLYLGINELNKSIYTGVSINKRSIYWKDNTGYFEADIYVYRK